MFYLSRIEHTLRVPPDVLSRPLTDAIKAELEKLFLDKVCVASNSRFCIFISYALKSSNSANDILMKVIANLGLCISVYDITSIEGGFIFPGDGAATYTVQLEVLNNIICCPQLNLNLIACLLT